jgi:hypothetical protein
VRRQEIVEGISQVVEALNRTGMIAVLESLLRGARAGGERPVKPEVLETFKRYLLAAQQYNAAAKYAAAVFGLTALEEAGFWSHASSEPSEVVHNVFSNARFAAEYLPKLDKLIQSESYDITKNLPKDPKGKGKEDLELLTLLLPEDAHQYSKPQRISEALMGITHLYEAVAVMDSVAENTLIVLACDSGSDKSFDLLGAAKVITGVKELILSVWDRIVFYREAQIAQRLELVTASLPILEKLSHLQNNNAIAPEQAELLRRKVLDGVGQLIASGATIPEMGGRSHVDPRQLMAPEPKLLTSGAGDPPSTAEASRGRGKRKPPQKKA